MLKQVSRVPDPGPQGQRQPRPAHEKDGLGQHERQHADVLAGQQSPARHRLGQQHGDRLRGEETGQETGRPDQRQEQAQRVGHARRQDQLEEVDRRANVSRHGHADGAEGQAQRAVGHRYARLLQLVRVLGLSIEARQEVGVLARPRPALADR